MGSNAISIALIGSGGAGVMTAGQILLDAAAKVGWYGLMARSLGPQIRGGESAALLRLSVQPIQSMADTYDLLVAVDWGNIRRFSAELPLSERSVIIADPAQGVVPELMLAAAPQVVPVEIKALAEGLRGGRPNMVALGLVSALIGLPDSACQAVLSKALARKGQAALDTSLAGVTAGREAAEATMLGDRLALAPPPAGAPAEGERWSITGNEATGMGALRGGVRFCAAYPITPATEVLEFLAPNLPRLGGSLVQAEDELASICMCLGGSYGGVPSLTATSGPGLALMLESLGLAVASEIPVVVINVQRGGPSTGIPTKSEQSDLNIAVHGLHGDAPHIVTAPLSIADSLVTTQWTVHLAESLQCPAIVLTDQAMGQARAIIDRPADITFLGKRIKPALSAAGVVAEDYQRYAVTASGVSPMAIPGMPGGTHTADGLEHNPTGMPSTEAQHHREQLDKRQRKLTAHDYGDMWAEITGVTDKPCDVAVITWGSVTEPTREAVAQALEAGLAVRLIAVRLLAPARPAQMAKALDGVNRLLVVEQNHVGQFHQLLRAWYDLPERVETLNRAGPLVMRPMEIFEALNALSARA